MGPAYRSVYCMHDSPDRARGGPTGADGPGNAAHDGDRLLGGTAPRTTEDEAAGMFIFYSNKFGCLGSILASVVLTAVLLLALRSCSGGIGVPGTP